MKRKLVCFFAVVMVSVQCLAALPVSDGLVMHLDAGSITGLADGDMIDTWTDLSGIGNDATQATMDNQPVFVASSSAFNGYSSVHFDGTNDWMTLPSTTCTVGSFTVFAVAKYDHLNSNQYIMAGQDGSGNDRMRFQVDTLISGKAPQFLWRAGSSGWTSIITDADMAVHVFGMTASPAIAGFLDGELIASASNTSTENPTAFNLGSYNRGQKDFFSGDIAELLIFNRALTTEEFTQVNDYLAAKYVPEPATLALLGMGALILRRKK